MIEGRKVVFGGVLFCSIQHTVAAHRGVKSEINEERFREQNAVYSLIDFGSLSCRF